MYLDAVLGRCRSAFCCIYLFFVATVFKLSHFDSSSFIKNSHNFHILGHGFTVEYKEINELAVPFHFNKLKT